MFSSRPDWLKPFSIYWTAYGGWKALRSSPYVYISFVPFLLLVGLWWPEQEPNGRQWPLYALSILPALISFSLAAMAIAFSMSSGAYLKLLHKKGASDSLFMKLIAVFFHFILIQVLALLAAMFVISCDHWIPSAVAFWLLCYALMSGIAAAANLVLIADIKNQASVLDDK